ncbi:helix-turn-helix transcriptional regulator [Nonomuraea gerenzanensis]|nr:AAA family ATPase [Nonomuraea gerenzanensis]
MTLLSADRMVGREDQLAMLRDAFGAASGGAPVAFVVGGEAGSGKTRLLRDFTAWVSGHGARVLAGGCLNLSAGDMAYAPLTEALRRLVRELGAPAVRRLAGRNWRELGLLLPVLMEEDQQEPSREGTQRRLFEAVLHLLDELGETGPVLFAVENLQWADRSTLDLLVFLIRTLQEERVLVVLTYRTDDLLPGHMLRGTLADIELSGRCRRCELARLDRDRHRELVAAILGGDPPGDLADRVFDRSDGNPFFTEELIAARDLGEQGVPIAVRDVVLARIEALSEPAQEVLRVVATAGRQVTHPLLARVCDLRERELRRTLQECVGRQILVVEPSRQTYGYRHELAREAVYAELLPGDRSWLHGAIAEALTEDPALSQTDSLNLAAELAHHWEQAHNVPQALAESVRGAAAAVSVFAYAEAARQYDRALRLWTRVPDAEDRAGLAREDLLVRAADAYRWSGRISEAVGLLDEILAKLGHDGEAARAGTLLERKGRYLWELGRGEESLRAYEEATRVLSGEPPSAEVAWTRAGYATALMQAGHYRAAIGQSEEALRIARLVGARAEEGRALNTMGVALTLTGAPEAGTAALRTATDIADELGALEDVFRAYANLAYVLEVTGELEEALDVARRGVDRGRDLGLELTGGGALVANAASVLVLLGRWNEAEEVAGAASARDLPPGFDFYLQIVRSEIEIGRGAFAAAEERLNEAGSVAARLDEPQFAGPLHVLWAELALWRGQHARALGCVDNGLAATAHGDHGGFALRLCAMGLRVTADEARRLRSLPRPDQAEIDQVVEVGARLLSQAEAAALGAEETPLPEMSATLALCRAESARLAGRHDVDAWEAVAESWLSLRRPYPAAYARWRQGEAAIELGDRLAAAEPLGEAARIAGRIGAEPLRAEVMAMAVAARVSVDAGHRPPPQQVPDPFGLTRREREVLRHLAQGQSNRQIARALFITEKTASVHVSHIMTKLGAATRGVAAVTARRHGLVDP